MRAQLPHRRPNLTLDLDWQGHAFALSVGFDPVSGAAREVFANTPKGGAIQAVLADACVLISIALQYGIGIEALGKSLGREPAFINGVEASAPASPVGSVVEALAAIAAGPVIGPEVGP